MVVAQPSDYPQADLPDAALDVDIKGDVGIPVGVVDVRVALPPEAFSVDLPQAAFGSRPHTHLAGHQHRGLPHPTLYAGIKVLGVIAREVNRGLACAHLEGEPS